MFDRWRHTTLRDGACDRGTVVNASQTRMLMKGVYTEVYEYRRTIRVTFRDGSAGEVEEQIPLHRVQELADRKTIDCWPELAERTKSVRSCRCGTTSPIIHTSSWTSQR